MDIKTLNVIQKNLMAGLVIDDSDSSMAYHKGDIDNNYNYTWDDIYKMFLIDPQCIFNCAIDKFVTLITKKDEEIPFSKHKRKGTGTYAFLKISTPIIANDENNILVDLSSSSHYIADNCQWQEDRKNYTYTVQNNNIENDFNGYENTLKILDTFKWVHTFASAKYCNKYSQNACEYVYLGYLPSAGEMIFICKYLSLINYILKTLKTNPIYSDVHCWWTSNDYNKNKAYAILNKDNDKFKIDYYDKTYFRTIMPLFKQIK